MNYHDVLKVVHKHHLPCRQEGSHLIIEAPKDEIKDGRGYMVAPCHPKDYGKGLECKIRKWFLKLGIIVCLGAVAYFVGVLEGVL